MVMGMRAGELQTCLQVARKDKPMLSRTDAKILMVGPDRSLKGGIVSVVNGYYEAGLNDRCAMFEYQGTGVGRNVLTKSLAFTGALLSYKRLLGNFDIIHLHISAKGSFERKAIMASLAKLSGKKVILHEHSGKFAHDFESGSRSYRDRVRSVFNGADRVVVLSEEWHDYFAENVVKDRDKLVVLHNGVSVPAKPCSPGLNQNVLFLGRLDENKRPDMLMEASRDVLKESPDMQLFFGGDGDLGHYEIIAKELGIADRCEFVGWVTGEKKEELFSRSGIFCLPSKYEAMPMSVMEAMAHGLPVVATRVGGVPQLIEDGADGVLIDVDDVESLGKSLRQLMGSAGERTRLGAVAREKIRRKFSEESTVNSMIDIYQELLRS